jgi:hypothetical protein
VICDACSINSFEQIPYSYLDNRDVVFPRSQA